MAEQKVPLDCDQQQPEHQAPTVNAVDFDDIKRQYEKRISAAVFRSVRHREDTEDIVQEVFVRFYQRLVERPDEEIKSPLAFLMSIATHLMIDYWRKKNRDPKLEPLNADLHEGAIVNDPIPEVEAKALACEVDEFIRRLAKKEDQTLLILVIYEGLKGKALADAMGISEKTAHWRKCRLLKALQERLSRKGWNFE